MRILLTSFLLLSALSFGGSASATVFDVSGSGTGIGGFPSGNITGTLTIDATAGTVTDVTVTFPGLGLVTQITGQASFSNEYSVEFAVGGSNSFTIPDSGSLVGYQGGSFSFSFLSDLKLVNDPRMGEQGTGTLTAEVATTPLPAALPLFASGLAAAGLVRWRRKRKAAALAA